VVFVSALLWFIASRRLGVLSLLLGVVGAALVGLASSSYGVMVVWLFIYSLGSHLYMPIASGIGMQLAREGHTGQRLGQLNAVRNFATILGSFFVFLGFRYLHFNFTITFILAAVMILVAAVLLFRLPPDDASTRGKFLEFHKEYNLYYILAILFGSRKQLFLTFAPWVLVSIFQQPTQRLATLLTIGGVIGVLFQPLLGWMIDRLGERVVLMSEAVLLVFVCFGYGFARFLFSESVALYVTFACFLFDQMLFSVSMARSTYIKKIALEPAHVQPALTMSVTIDHVFSIAAALLGGFLWKQFGYQYVFLMGAGIAVLNFIAASHVRIPRQAAGEAIAVK
jgi:predicted MFS family arabinose efflux permease